MYVFVRLAKVIIQSYFVKKSAALDPVDITLRVWPNDLDVYLHVNNGRYLTLMDLGRFAYTFRTPLIKVFIRNRWSPVLGSGHVKWKRSLLPFQKFTLRTRIAGWDKKWFYFEQSFIRDDTVYAIGLVKGVIRHGRATIPTSEVLKALGIETAPSLSDDAVRLLAEID